jgi:hypothetical protein
MCGGDTDSLFSLSLSLSLSLPQFKQVSDRVDTDVKSPAEFQPHEVHLSSGRAQLFTQLAMVATDNTGKHTLTYGIDQPLYGMLVVGAMSMFSFYRIQFTSEYLSELQKVDGFSDGR